MALAFTLIGIALIGSGILFLMYSYKKDKSSTVERAQNLSQSKYDPNMTRFAAGKEANASEARGSLLTNVNYEIGQLTETINKEAEALRAGYKKDAAFSDYSIQREKDLADHQSYLALAENKSTVARMATQMGLDPATVKELILEEARTKKELLLEEVRMQAQLAFKMQEMELEVEKARRLKAIDLDFEKKMAMLDKDMAEIQHLLPEHLVNALHKQLSDVNMEYEQVKELEEGDYKERETKRVSMKMKALEKNIRERQKNFSA